MHPHLKYIVTLLGLIVLVIYGVYATTKSYKEVLAPQPPPAVSVQSVDYVSKIINKMTLEEKIAQMFLAGIYAGDSTKILQNLIEQKKIGSVILMNLNITNQKIYEVTAALQNIATSSGQPMLLISIDQEGGVVSRVKDPQWELTSQTKIKSSLQAYDVAFVRGQELRTSGINVNFAPVLDYITNPSSFLYNRVFRGTKEDATSLGIAMINGYRDAGIAATIKHYPGHDNASVDSHHALPVSQITEENIYEYARVFHDVIDVAAPPMVMTGHVLFPKIDSFYPATLSPVIIGLLRTKLGSYGVIITDDMNMGAITTKFSVEEASKQAVIAGNDILLYVATKEIIDRAYRAVVNAVKDGHISEHRIDSSVHRILSLKKSIQ